MEMNIKKTDWNYVGSVRETLSGCFANMGDGVLSSILGIYDCHIAKGENPKRAFDMTCKRFYEISSKNSQVDDIKWHKFSTSGFGFFQLVQKSAMESGREFVAVFTGQTKTIDVRMFGDGTDAEFIRFMETHSQNR